jgi:signal transduction histidine kinase
MRAEIRDRLDIVLAVAVVVAGEAELIVLRIQPAAVAVPLALVAGASLAVRRRFPLAVMAVCFAALAADTWCGVPLDRPVVPLAWIFISTYTVGVRCSLREAAAGLALGLAVFATTLAKDSSDLLFGLAVIAAPWLVGRAMRSRVSEASGLADRAEAAERQRDEQVKAAAAAERARIARDLHDVIAHSVSVMVVQAGAAAEVFERDPARAAAAMQSVQDTGRQALTEMGALLGILRADGEEIGLAPQPGLADLDQLVERARDGGLPVELRLDGDRRALPPGVELSIYRVVQEALTNTRKHARNAHAVVTLRYVPGEVCLEISDDGAAAAGGYGGHHGIVGMRERVAVYGGTLEAGPLPGRGYAVRARIPTEPAGPVT